MGGDGKIVEADETYFGKREDARVADSAKGRPYKSKKARPAEARRRVAGRARRLGSVFPCCPCHEGERRHDRVDANVAAKARSTPTKAASMATFAKRLRRAPRRSSIRTANMSVAGDVHTNTVEGYLLRSSSAA